MQNLRSAIDAVKQMNHSGIVSPNKQAGLTGKGLQIQTVANMLSLLKYSKDKSIQLYRAEVK